MNTRAFVLSSVFLWAGLLAAGLLVGPAAASAQVRDGVPIARLTPPSTTLSSVSVSVSLDQPVELAFARGTEQRPSILVSVLVADDATAARTALARLVETTSGSLGELAGIGSIARGDRAFVAFARDNVFALVRSTDGSDVVAIAEHVDRAILAAPIAPRVRPTAARLVMPSVQNGAALPIAVEGDVLGAFVEANGDAYVRRTRTGWSLVRSGTGAYDVEAITVDSKLRLSRAVVSSR
jgi:hypothetical protein